MRSVFWLLPAVLGFSLATAAAQTGAHHMPTPPEPLDPQSHNAQPLQTPTRRIDSAQVQKEADELARMAQTIPPTSPAYAKACCPKM